MRIARVVSCAAVFLTFASGLAAQVVPAVTPAAVFRRFLAVATLVGKPASTLTGVWPAPVSRGDLMNDVAVTGAHRIRLFVTVGPGSDVVPTLGSVSLTERLPDTLSLRTRVLELARQLERTSGTPTQCVGPLGPPAYLFAPQHAARAWVKGVATAPTMLQWEVTPERVYAITVTVGMLPTFNEPAMPCDATFP